MRILYRPHEFSQQRQHEKKIKIYPILLAMQAQWHKEQGDEVDWEHGTGKYDKIIYEPEKIPFLSLPHPDRIFTKAKEYVSGNYKHLPGTHMMAASGCWHAKCTFCVERGTSFEVRPVEDVIEEIKECKQLGFKEVFDDSATFPIGDWLSNFCDSLMDIKKIHFSCNMRLVDCNYEMLHRAGFRMLLFGIESANQFTLDKINKKIKAEDIIPIIKKAKKAGLDPHVAGMIGYPWETLEDTMRTIDLFKHLLIKGYAKTAQMSFYTPPKPQQQGNEEFRKYVNKFYEAGFNLEFWYNKIIDVRSLTDLHYLTRGIKEGFKGLLKRRKKCV